MAALLADFNSSFREKTEVKIFRRPRMVVGVHQVKTNQRKNDIFVEQADVKNFIIFQRIDKERGRNLSLY